MRRRVWQAKNIFKVAVWKLEDWEVLVSLLRRLLNFKEPTCIRASTFAQKHVKSTLWLEWQKENIDTGIKEANNTYRSQIMFCSSPVLTEILTEVQHSVSWWNWVLYSNWLLCTKKPISGVTRSIGHWFSKRISTTIGEPSSFQTSR